MKCEKCGEEVVEKNWKGELFCIDCFIDNIYKDFIIDKKYLSPINILPNKEHLRKY